MMKKISWFCVVLLLFPLISQATERVIYFANITDISGDVNLVYELKFANRHYIETRKGDSGVNIPFNKIKSIEIISRKGVTPLEKYANLFFPCLVTLTSGEQIKVLIADLYFEGKTEFADRYIIRVPKVQSVEFLHEGRYKQCPLCNTIYYNTELEHCKFDGETLVKK